MPARDGRDARSPTPASPGPSPRTPSSPRFGDVERTLARRLPRGLRGGRRRARPSPASCRSRTSSTARSARTTTCSSSTTWRSAARSSCRSACAWPRCPVSGSTTSSGSTRTSRRSARPRRSCARRPWQLLSTYNTAGAGKAIADRGERGAAAVLSPRAAALFGLEVLADEIGDLPGNRTRFVVLGPTRRRRPRPLRRARRRADGRRSSSPSATSRARCSRSCGSSPTTA